MGSSVSKTSQTEMRKEIERLKNEVADLDNRYHHCLEQKQNNVFLRESEEKFSAAFRSNPNALILSYVDDGTVIDVNDSFISLFKWGKEEVVGKTSLSLNMYSDPGERERIVDIMRTDGRITNHEMKIGIKSGEERTVLLSAELLHIHRDQAMLTTIQDITDRKNMEDALKVEHSILDAVINNIGVGFIVADTVGNILSLNDSALKMHGFRNEEEKLSQLKQYLKEFDLEYPDGRQMLQSKWPLALAIKGEYVKDYKVRLIRKKSGTVKNISYSTVPIYNSNGALIFFVLTLKDYTEIFERTEALHESERHYQSLFNNSTMGIAHCEVITDEQGKPVDYRILQINEAYTKITGINKPEIEGKTASEVFPGIRNFSFDYIGNYGKIASEGGELNFDTYFEPTNQWLSIYVYRPKEGEFTAIFTDISERKRIEEEAKTKAIELRKNEQRLQGVFDNAAIGIVEFDTEDRLIAVNDRSCDILGYKREELLGRNITEITAPEDLKQTIEMNRRLRQGEYSIFDYEKRYIKSDGSLLWVHVTVSAVRDSHGKHINSIGTFEDISERKKIEQAINRSETILKQAGILANLGAWEIEYNQIGNKNSLHWSDQVYRIFGYQPGSVTVNNAFFYEHVHPDDRQKVRKTIAKAIAERNSYTIEHRIIRADGVERKVIEYAEISFDKTGKPLRIIGAVQDITERKIEEEKLHEALQQAEEGRNILTALMEYIPVGISIADAPNAKIRMMSRYGLELLEISETEIPDLPAPGHLSVWGTFHSDGVSVATPEDLPLARAIMKGEIIKNEEWIIKRRSGALVPVLCSAAPILDKDGKVVGGVTGWQDIAERRRALKALEESEEKFRSLFENITEGVALHELVYENNKPVNYRILDVNPAFKEHTGLDQEKARGALATDLYNSPDPPYLKEYSDVAITRKPYRFSVFYAPMNRHLEISAISPKKDQFATVFEDVTEQKKNEIEIKQKNEELTRFIYTVSHDLKSPLVTIKAFTSYLKEDLESNDKAAQDKDINYIQNAADKMGKLLDELLELSRVGRQEKPKTKATLKSIAQSAIDLVAGRLAKNKIKIQFTGPPVMLYGHTQRFIQLYQNLIDNSAKFMGDQPEPLVEIGSFSDAGRNNEVVLFVRDNGSGIDPRYHHKIFGLFEKMDNQTEGTGIGLALIKRIVEVHGGSIWFESGDKHKGTTFYFTLEGTQIIN